MLRAAWRDGVALLVLALATAALPAAAQSWTDRFVDPSDGKFDLSEHLLQYRGALPVPIIVTEPALGYGGGAALLYFRESIADASARASADGQRMTPPDIAGLAGFKTANGSQGVGAGMFGTLQGDRYRYLFGVANAELNLDFYGLAQRPRQFAIDAPAAMAQGLARLGSSDWFAGPRYLYVGSTVQFVGERPPEIDPRDLEANIGRLSAVVDYDSRDNIFTPSSGTYAEFEAAVVRPGLGASSSFNSASARAFTYLPLARAAVLGLRGQGDYASDGVPFYAEPFIMLRGVPALRYQGRKVLVGETELRYNLDARWAMVGFGGVGKAYGKRVDFSSAETVIAGGVGFRYLIARKLGMYAGLDVARGPEETTVYIQVGSAWR
jgi:hypothetical protein